MLVLHDDAEREYAYGPAPRAARYEGRHLHSSTLRRGEEGWLVVISMKNDWKRIFAFEN